MATYLLLRNNKNSGPYTLEALVQLGLKPYDLVWVEGKSAAWRYPSEVEDLKFYAPAVEEQPYDRFYKKPSEEKTESEKKKLVIQEVKPVPQEVIFTGSTEVNQTINIADVKTPKKQVFVSLPANGINGISKKTEQVVAKESAHSTSDSNNGNITPVKKPEQPVAPSYSELVNEYNNHQSFEKKIVIQKEETPPVKKQVVAETKYSQTLDDIKDIYVQTLADRKRKTAQKKMIMMMVKRGLPFAAVLVIGFFLGGIVMNKKSGNGLVSSLPVNSAVQKDNPGISAQKKEDAASLQQQVQTPQTQQPETVLKEEPANPSTAKTNDASGNDALIVQNDLKTDKKSTTAIPLNIVKKFVAKENETTKATNENATLAGQKAQNIEVDPRTGERNKIVRSGTESNGDNNNGSGSTAVPIRNAAWKQVNVKGNEYKVGTFGGIHDLQLTVTNNSNYLLDRVIVELQYLKPADQPLKTNNIQFDMVPPNGSLTLDIPPTNRGVKVAYHIIHVESKAAGNDTAGL